MKWMNALSKGVERMSQQLGSNILQELAGRATGVQVRTNESQLKCLKDRGVSVRRNQSWTTEPHKKEIWLLWVTW
jgi:hypothetical protein